MKSFRFTCLLFGALLIAAGVLHAEGECPPGMFPTNPPGAGGPVGCAPIPSYGQQQSSQCRLPINQCHAKLEVAGSF
jgi:hypothetical protein